VRALAHRVYLLALAEDCIPIYPVYALLFADSGLSTGRISALFMLWSVTSFLLEVPSGALADRVSRRRLLAVAAGLRGVGFALWVAVPSFSAFAAGFVLWGAGGQQCRADRGADADRDGAYPGAAAGQLGADRQAGEGRQQEHRHQRVAGADGPAEQRQVLVDRGTPGQCSGHHQQPPDPPVLSRLLQTDLQRAQ